MPLSEDFCDQLGAGIAGAVFGRPTKVKEVPMAGTLTKPKRKRKAKFIPPRSHGIQTIEDESEDPRLGVSSSPDAPFAKPGDVVRTSYGTGPYLVETIKATGRRGGRPVFSMSLRDADGRKRGQSWLNDYQRQADGRILSGNDELFVTPAEQKPTKGAKAKREKCKDPPCVERLIGNGRPPLHPALTGNSTPAGIAHHDPSAWANGQQAAAPPPEGEAVVIPLASIDPSPTNPRQDFDEEEIAGLAASIRSVGLLEPLIVRRQPRSERYELVAGERRYRACKLAGLVNVSATLRELTDAQVLEIQIIENLQRKGLNAVEEAKSFQRAMLPPAKGGCGYSQTQLADKLGCTQAHVSNRVRLLELPKEWQDRVLKGELPPTHARSLVPWAKYPRVLQAMERSIKRDGIGSAEMFDDVLGDALDDVTEPMAGTKYSHKSWRQIPIFEPTPEQREQLQLVEIPTDKKGKTELRAMNTKLWQQLQQKHETAWLKEHDNREDRKAKKKEKQQAQVKLTPAQQKAKDKKLAEQFSRRLDEWRADWYRVLVARKLSPRHWAATKLALYFLAGGSAAQLRYHGPTSLVDVLEHFPGQGRRRSRSPGDQELFELITEPALNRGDIPQALCDLMRAWLIDEDADNPEAPVQPVKFVPLWVLDQLLIDLEIDLAAEWAARRAGPLTEAYFRLHTSAQLQALAKELLPVEPPPASSTKGQLITELMGRISPKLPKELQPKGSKS